METKVIHVTSYGRCKALEVENLKPGMVTIWTGGWKEEIAGVRQSPSGKTFQIVYKDGKVDHRRMRKGRLIAVDL